MIDQRDFIGNYSIFGKLGRVLKKVYSEEWGVVQSNCSYLTGSTEILVT